MSSQAVIFTVWKYQKCYFHSVRTTSYCDVKSCIACSVYDLNETGSKTKENVINIKLKYLDVECGIYRVECRIFKYFHSCLALLKINKRPTGIKDHLSIRDSTLNSCQKGSYLQFNRPIIEHIKINNGSKGKLHYIPFLQNQ